MEGLRKRLSARLRERGGLGGLYDATGVPLHASYAPALLEELAELAELESLPEASSKEPLYRGDRAAGEASASGEGERSRSSSLGVSVARVACWQTVSSWVIGRWCGNLPVVPVSTSEASWTGLLNIHSCDWHWDLCNELPLQAEPVWCFFFQMDARLERFD